MRGAVAPRLLPVAVLDDLPQGIGRLVLAGGREIALFRCGDTVWAIDARCPHAQGPLHDGMLCGEAVICPLHQRRVDVRTGAVEDWPHSVRTYRVVVDEGRVFLEL